VSIISEKSLAVLEHKGKYAAGVFTNDGLYSTCFPFANETDAIKCVGGIGLPRNDDPKHLRVLELVFAAAEGRKYEVESIQFDFSGYTKKQARMLKAAMQIEWGEFTSYGELAEMAGFPKAARFAGNCMNKNRYAPLVPCHRIVASNGIGGFGGNIERKKALLMVEGSYERILKKRFKSGGLHIDGP
jgi:methylated-DNA-[protein]-cysteine S-methyltransferase